MSNGANPAAGNVLNFESSQGALVTPHYVGRKMTFYAVQENELKATSFTNTLMTIAFSIASGLLMLGIGIRVEAEFQEKLSAVGVVLNDFAAPGLWAAAGIMYMVGFLALYFRRSMMGVIKKESTTTKIKQE